jgi:hypothetical protein
MTTRQSFVRPGREDDFEDVVRMIESADRALGHHPEPVREDLIWTWALPMTDLERDVRIALDGGEVVGYAEAMWRHPEEGGPVYGTVRVTTDERGSAIRRKAAATAAPTSRTTRRTGTHRAQRRRSRRLVLFPRRCSL